MTIYTWSTTADTNANADYPFINWNEFQDPDTVNNSARGMMARIAAWRDDTLPKRVTTGTTNAYLVTAAAAPASFSADFVVWFRADRSNSGSATLKVNDLTSKPLRAKSGTGLAPGEIQASTIVGAYYVANTDEFLIVNSGFHANALLPSMVTAYAVGLKAGMMTDWAGSELPTGYLWCDGAAVSRAAYAELFAAIGTTYGAGDGSTTFNVPDRRGRASFGRDNMGGTAANRITNAGSGIVGTTLGASGGAQSVTLSEGQLPSHSHGSGTLVTNSDGAHTHTTTIARNLTGGTSTSSRLVSSQSDQGYGVFTATSSSGGAHTHSISGSTGSAGSGQAHNNMPPALVCNVIILATPTAAGGGDIVPTYAVDGLPTSGPNIAIASNGRKNGEGAGDGTGVLCFRVGTAWFAVDTGSTVQA